MIPATKFSGLVVTANLLFAFWIEYHCFWLLESKSQIYAFLSAHLLWVIIFCLNSKWSFFSRRSLNVTLWNTYLGSIHEIYPQVKLLNMLQKLIINICSCSIKNYKTLAQWGKYINVFLYEKFTFAIPIEYSKFKIIINNNTSWIKYVFVLYIII